MKSRVALLLLGIVLGLAAALLAPGLWHRVTPAGLRAAPTVGVVESKRWEDDRLLLTLITADGAVLATFGERVAEIDLLVDVGDTVELGLRRYRPFAEDPVIDRVVKAAPSVAAAGEEPPAAPPFPEPPAPAAPGEPPAEPEPPAAGPAPADERPPAGSSDPA